MDMRAWRRLRSRLRPAKVLTEDARFVCDCAITDLSAVGARLRFFEATDLPQRFVVFDEGDIVKRQARCVWSTGREAGIRFMAGAEPVSRDERERIAGRYYAV